METSACLFSCVPVVALNLPYLGMETGLCRGREGGERTQSSLFRNGNVKLFRLWVLNSATQSSLFRNGNRRCPPRSLFRRRPQSSLFRNGNTGRPGCFLPGSPLNLPYLGMETGPGHHRGAPEGALNLPYLGMETYNDKESKEHKRRSIFLI